jgi:hypothetical protein
MPGHPDTADPFYNTAPGPLAWATQWLTDHKTQPFFLWIHFMEPGLLTRTPYDKRAVKPTAERFAGAGHAAVVQDTRGAYASEGRYVHYNNDDQDGYDTNGSCASRGATAE